MISIKVEKALNNQIAMEANASAVYLAMASWADHSGLEGAAQFFYGHSEEEHVHMMKIVRFLNEVGGCAVIPSVTKPKATFKSVKEACDLAYKHEIKVSKSIHKIVDLSRAENDHVTDAFLRWFVEEQREEEVLFMRVMDKINMIGSGGQSLFYIDNELGQIAAAEAAPAADAGADA
ncbi:MAG: ferritin [Limisphaerales bacterium]|jgi:ferritin